MRKVFAVALMLVLFFLPLAIRYSYFYRGQAEERKVPYPDLDDIAAPIPDMEPFADHYAAAAPGVILVDVAHENRFEMSELSVLQARLSARGQRIEPLQSASDLAEQLRYAKALVIVSPGDDWTADEIQLVESFVEKGGRLLLITDATNFDVDYDSFTGEPQFSNDAEHVNDLAAQFGLIFQSDYLYNTVENEGNFRNIKLTDLGKDPLTAGLEQVVFYAAHSIRSDETALISAGGETRSSNSERAEELAVAVLAADGAVLALGDLSFMSEPQNAVYDNDQLIANVADFLSGAQRQYELADAPFFFDDEVDLVYAGDPLLDSDLLAGGSDLQAYFADEGKVLTVREIQDPTHDTLFLGLYAHTEEVTPYLDAAGVTFVITLTETTATPTTTETLTSTTPISPSQALTATLDVTATDEFTLTTETLTVTTSISPSQALTTTPGITVTDELIVTPPPAAESRVEIASLGRMIVTGTALLTLQTQGERHVLIALAHTQTGLENAVERLTQNDLQDCLLQEKASPPTVLALCPTGEVDPGEGGGGWQTAERPPAPTPAPTSPITDTVEPEEPVGEPEGSILVVAFDSGEGRYDSLTSAEDYKAILERRFDVTVWSKAQDGSPGESDLLDYDLIVWTTGDFEDVITDKDGELLWGIILEEIPLILSGAYLDDTVPQAVQRDIQVKDADHPVAQGFDPEEVISFVPAPSGSEYEIAVMDTGISGEDVAVFSRGPDSKEADADSILIAADELLGMRIAFIGFPIYLLPDEAKTRLVLNMVDWMLDVP